MIVKVASDSMSIQEHLEDLVTTRDDYILLLNFVRDVPSYLSSDMNAVNLERKQRYTKIINCINADIEQIKQMLHDDSLPFSDV